MVLEAIATGRQGGLSWRTTLLPSPWACTASHLPWDGFVGVLPEMESEGSD
jgi:hypothetical protein